MKFHSKSPQYEHIHKRWTGHHRSLEDKVFNNHLRQVTLGGLAGLTLLPISGNIILPNNVANLDADQVNSELDMGPVVAEELKPLMPSTVRPLEKEEDINVSYLLSKDYGVKVSSKLDGISLDRSYGLIGGEQHLYRYPGDGLFLHATQARDWAMFGGAGIAPHLGAWGYFAPSKHDFTALDEQRERYYIAVPTFLTAGYAENTAEYRDFFKYRKMLVVNPDNGKAVIADIGDSGPSPWTGKNLGGSPEVMDALGLGSGPRKGDVLYFFVDDSNQNVDLGPIKPLQKESK